MHVWPTTYWFQWFCPWNHYFGKIEMLLNITVQAYLVRWLKRYWTSLYYRLATLGGGAGTLRRVTRAAAGAIATSRGKSSWRRAPSSSKSTDSPTATSARRHCRMMGLHEARGRRGGACYRFCEKAGPELWCEWVWSGLVLGEDSLVPGVCQLVPCLWWSHRGKFWICISNRWQHQAVFDWSVITSAQIIPRENSSFESSYNA